jgi:hypothetical protein
VKDFEQTIPGHGGVTDRMDCQLLMALFTTVYLNAFVRCAPRTSARVTLRGSERASDSGGVAIASVRDR